MRVTGEGRGRLRITVQEQWQQLKRQARLKDLDRIEVQFGVEAALNVAAFAKSVLLAGKQEVADRLAPAAERRNHGLGLVRRHDRVLVALEEDHRLRQAIGMEQRRACAIERLLLRIRTD